MTKKVLIGVGIIILGLIGFEIGQGIQWATEVYVQHRALLQWAGQTDKELHPEKYAPAPKPVVEPKKEEKK